MELVDELCWILEDSSRHIAGRIHAATQRYLSNLLPPLANAMVRGFKELIRLGAWMIGPWMVACLPKPLIDHTAIPYAHHDKQMTGALLQCE